MIGMIYQYSWKIRDRDSMDILSNASAGKKPRDSLDLDNTDKLWKMTLSLPIFPDMKEQWALYVCDMVKKWVMSRK